MFRHARRALAVFVVLGWVTGCSDMGAPLLLVPRAEFSATALSFGTLAVGDSSARVVSIGNSGNAPLAGVASVACPDFRIRSGGGAFTVAPGATHSIEVVYRASGVGSSTCALELGGSLPPIALSGDGALQSPGAAGELSASALVFGSLKVGQSAQATFQVRSTGSAPLRVDVSGACADFTVVTGAGPGTIAPGDSLAVTVRFAPLAGGHLTCTLPTGPGLPEVALSGDATTVSFAADIRPILLNQGCYSCHDHLYLNASDLVNVAGAFGPCAPAVLVVPYDLANSLLYKKITNTQPCGDAMPLGTTGLPPALRDKFRAWILEGALDN